MFSSLKKCLGMRDTVEEICRGLDGKLGQLEPQRSLPTPRWHDYMV